MGCGASPREAISRVFDDEEVLIVLEDDCIPSLDFIPWANELLDAFAKDDRVGAICGFQPCPASHVSQDDIFWASYLFAGWGWATWKRNWLDYKSDISGWRDEITLRSQLRNASSLAGLRWFRANWDWVSTRQEDVWDHQFGFLMAQRQQLVLKPPVNLIENIGTNERATHTYDLSSVGSTLVTKSIPTGAQRWGSLKVNRRADRWILKHDYRAQSTWAWLGDLTKAAANRLLGRSG